MPSSIEYTCPKNITSFLQCEFPEGVSHVYCDNNHINSFQYLPESVRAISCENNQIKSFQYLPESVYWIYCGNNQIKSFQYLSAGVLLINCDNNQIKSFKYLPDTVTEISCEDNQINSFNYLPESVFCIDCDNNPCNAELISKNLPQIRQENNNMISQRISNFYSGISKLRYMRLNYLIHSRWKRYWYDQRDGQGYSRACRYLAAKNCPNGFLSIT